MTAARRAGGLIARGLAASTLVLGTIGLAAAPAQADSAGFTGYGPGFVGVPQTIMFASAQDPTSCGSMSMTINYSSPPQSTSIPASSVSGGNVYFTWVPTIAGTVSSMTMLSTGACTPTSVTNVPFQISPVPTTTTVNAPNTGTVGQSTRVQVTIQSQSPSQYQPTGTITVVNANGASVSGAMGLTPGPGNGQSYAYFYFTPPSAGTYYFQARYNGDANASASPMSPLDTMIATPSGATIAISAPPTMTFGQTVTLTATVYPIGTAGSVGFTINGAPISASIPLNAQGQASMNWQPNVAGQVTLGASYTTNAGGSGSTSEQVTISGTPAQQDAITLVQPGWGPWGNGGTYQLGNGSNFTFQASSLSGSPVTLTETGPCGLNGLTITVPVGSGQCNLQARTNGGNGYAPVTYGYTVALVPGTQTANVAAPQSGRFRVGRSLLLESPGASDTNAGQNINWTVTRGNRRICSLQYPSNGSVTLRIIRRGQCNVQGTAPGVPGQWNPFSVQRSYRGF